jgi:hypothetical protein
MENQKIKLLVFKRIIDCSHKLFNSEWDKPTKFWKETIKNFCSILDINYIDDDDFVYDFILSLERIEYEDFKDTFIS